MRRHLTVEEASRAMGFLQTGLSQRQGGAQFNGVKFHGKKIDNNYILTHICLHTLFPNGVV